MTKVDIVLPVYNEEEGIASFHSAINKVLDGLSERYEFRLIYVLDRSRDASFETLKRLALSSSNTTVVHLSRRFGHQMSLVAGIDISAGDAVIMMDSDMQHPPEVIPQLLQKFEQGFDVVHTIRRYERTASLQKRWTSAFFYRIQNALSPVEIHEGMADFRLISRKVAEVFRHSIREQNQFLRGLFQWVGFRSTSISFTSAPRAAGRTKYHLSRLVAFSVTGILSFSKVPLRFATLLGLTISTLSVMYAFWLITVYFTHGHFPPGYASLILVVLFTGGLQLMVLGIMGEYIGSVFDEVKNRPLYIVDEIVGGEMQ